MNCRIFKLFFFFCRKEAKLFVLLGNFETNVLLHKICHGKSNAQTFLCSISLPFEKVPMVFWQLRMDII